MKLSIIVPVYNVEQYLPRCLDSLLAQGLEDYEIVAVNDGGTDGSRAILEEYRARVGERLRVIDVTNGGQGRARNIGMGAARGEYLGFADSDDWVEPTMFRTLLTTAERTGADLVLCDARQCWENGESIVLPLAEPGQELRATAVWNKLVKRSLAQGIRFPEGRLWYEDLPVSVKLALGAEKLAWVREPLYNYRVGQTSTMRNQNAVKNLDMLVILEELKTWMLPRGFQREFELIVINHLLLDTINRVNAQSSPEKKPVIRKLRQYVKENIPNLAQCESYRQEPRNRRIVMRLNYLGLEDVAKLLLKIKQKF